MKIKKENKTTKNPQEKDGGKKRVESAKNVAKPQIPLRTKREKAADNLPFFKAVRRIRIEGLNQTRLINELNKEIGCIQNIRRVSPKLLEITILERESKKAFAILQKMCYNYLVLAKSGPRMLFASCLTHIGLLVGALVFGACLIFASQTVWKIEISGNILIDELTITDSLKQCGVTVGAFKNKLDMDDIEAAIRNVTGVAAVSAELKGTTVYIRVLEEKQYIPPDAEVSYKDVTSKYDAEITRISVKSGTGYVEIGGRVKAGQTLIKAERLDSAGEVMGPVKAEGSVYGKVTFKETHIFSDKEEILSVKGDKKTSTTLSIFGLKIGKKPDIAGKSVTTTAKLFFIPIKVTRTEYYQTEIVTRERDIDAYINTLKSQALLANVIKAGGSEIETVSTLTNLESGLYMLNIYISAEILIGEA